ncbi:MAG: sugar ABC transporter substrate-binding protein [Geminicoccaceae bacterium]|jgi:ABC-type glycerol-3-phosphate transport system substrate-binding protein|nr:sugar ABC transporter substrate-binding protein [Geminicoccaceae bacterium]HRY24581.1 sugar ABC transporter substrate-binding protein [Geminicoccaceae bacterium]
MRKLLLGTTILGLGFGAAEAQTLNILMESVPDTRFVEELLPEFEAATGIDVELEVVNYAEMHTKLVPQLVSPTGSYDVIVVDFYWVGEFAKAGWLQPLDERIAADGFDTSVYFDSLQDLVGQVDGEQLMLPFYNYAMGLTYRHDLLEDPAEQAAFKEKYGIELRVPETWDEYLQQVEFFTRDTDGDGKNDFFGVVNQGLRPDPIAMEWSNYLFANGGRFHDESWQPMLDSPEAVKAVEDYKRNLEEFGPLGAASFGFDEAFNVAAQGKAYSYLTYNMFRTAYDDPSQSAVVDKMEIVAVPNGGLNGAWGWAIPNSSPDPDAAWTFLKWVESPEIAKKRAMLGGSPTRKDVFADEEVLAKYPYYPALENLLATSHNFPVFTYTPQFVEVLGRELSLAVTGEKTAEEAMQTANAELEALLKQDGKL